MALERTVGGTQVRVIYPGAAHAPDNIVTFFPESGVLFGGCLVKSGDDLGNLGDADSRELPARRRAPASAGPPLRHRRPRRAHRPRPARQHRAPTRPRRTVTHGPVRTHATTCRWAVGVNSGASPGEGIMGGRVVHEPDEEHRRGAHQRCSVLGCP